MCIRKIKECLVWWMSCVNFAISLWSRAVRWRTGGRRQRWVVLWPAAAPRRAFFIGGSGSVALWSAAASDRMREHWNSALAGQAFFSGFSGVSHFTCDDRWAASVEKLTVNNEYACCAQFYSLSELIVHCLISGGSYKCNVECWGDADSTGVENAALEIVGEYMAVVE